ncbi:DUF2723 domain-containing protein [Candidatus Gottesmanbacteria bacterium]|nr:DUF2723 domain-containing protein [Candidatus Gottesmanbacteria bacterium]
MRNFWVHVFLGVVVFGIYCLLLSKSIVGGDAGDLASSAYLFGVPHPPGYPLYTFIAAVFSHTLPFSTVAWRIGLVSAIFGALSVVVFYHTCLYLTRNRACSFITALCLAFVYPFWLYSEVVEVFSLAVFIVLCILFISLSLGDHFSKRLFYILLFFLGLTVTHHHTALFLIPTVGLLIRPSLSNLSRYMNIRFIAKSLLAFLIGLLPFSYLPIASFFHPAIDWERPSSVLGFINLLFRVSYGTFQAGASIVDDPIGRLISLATFFELSFFDLGIVGLVFGIVGILAGRKLRYFAGLFAGLFFYTFFFFYASFPVVNAFSLGTFERFAIFPYLFFLFFVAFGFDFLQKKMKRKWIVFLFLLYPILLFYSSISSIYAIKDRLFAEELGENILQSARDNSLILLANDTPLFSTQYVYFAQKNSRYMSRIPIHFNKLFFTYYYETLKYNYPHISIPSPKDNTDDLEYLSDFMDLNAGKSNIYTNFYLSDLAPNFVPSGLLFRYIPTNEKYPSLASVISENSAFWNKRGLIDPTEAYYENNFAAEILNVYSNALQNYAHYLIDKSQWKTAGVILKKAKNLTPADTDIAFLEGLIYENQGECKIAEKKYLAVSIVHPSNGMVWGQLAHLSRTCFSDEVKAKEYDKKQKSLGDTSVPLEQL